MRTVQHCHTRWRIKLHGATTLTRAECANHCVVVNGPKTHHLMASHVRDEDFVRRRHHGDTKGTLQRARGSLQLPHPRAIQSPQHHHPVVVIYHEEKLFVRGERQATRVLELAGLVTPRTDGALPLALHLGKSRGSKRDTQHIFL